MLYTGISASLTCQVTNFQKIRFALYSYESTSGIEASLIQAQKTSLENHSVLLENTASRISLVLQCSWNSGKDLRYIDYSVKDSKHMSLLEGKLNGRSNI